MTSEEGAIRKLHWREEVLKVVYRRVGVAQGRVCRSGKMDKYTWGQRTQ